METEEDLSCSGDAEAAVESDEYCGILTNAQAVFSECLANEKLNEEAKQLFEACKMDTCINWNNFEARKKSACVLIEEFKESCEEHGIHVDVTQVCRK